MCARVNLTARAVRRDEAATWRQSHGFGLFCTSAARRGQRIREGHLTVSPDGECRRTVRREQNEETRLSAKHNPPTVIGDV